MNKLTRTVGKAKAIQLRKGVGCHKKKNKARGHLAKLRGVLDPKREPTIPFRTKLGPVPVRVPTFRNENEQKKSSTNPSSVGSIGNREVKKFSDFPPTLLSYKILLHLGMFWAN